MKQNIKKKKKKIHKKTFFVRNNPGLKIVIKK